MERPAESTNWEGYRALPEDQRWELIDGQLYQMSSSPRFIHQALVGSFQNDEVREAPPEYVAELLRAGG